MSTSIRNFFAKNMVTATGNKRLQDERDRKPTPDVSSSQQTSSLGSDEKQVYANLEDPQGESNIKIVESKKKSSICPTSGGRNTPNMARRAQASATQRLKTQYTLPSPPSCSVYADAEGIHTSSESTPHRLMTYYIMKMVNGGAESLTTTDCEVDGFGVEVKSDVPEGVLTNGNMYIAGNNRQLLVASILVCYRTLRVYSNGEDEVIHAHNKIADALKLIEDLIHPADMEVFRDSDRAGGWERKCGHLKTPIMYISHILPPAMMNEFLTEQNHVLIHTFTEDSDPTKMRPQMKMAGDLVSQAACMSTGLPVNNEQLREFIRPAVFHNNRAPTGKTFSRTEVGVKIACDVFDSDPTRKKMYNEWFGQVDGGVMMRVEQLDTQFRDMAPNENNKKAFHELARSGVGALSNILMGFLHGRRKADIIGDRDLPRIYSVLCIPNIVSSLYALRLDGLTGIFMEKLGTVDPIPTILANLPRRLTNEQIVNATRSDPSSLEFIGPTLTAFDFKPIKYDTGRFHLGPDEDYFPDFAKATVIPSPDLVWETPVIQPVTSTIIGQTNEKVRTIEETTALPYAASEGTYYEAQFWAMTMPKIAHSNTISMAGTRIIPEIVGETGRTTFFGSPDPEWLRLKGEGTYAVTSGIVGISATNWPKSTVPREYHDSSMRMSLIQGVPKEENSTLENALVSVFMMARGASLTRAEGIVDINKHELVDPVRQAYNRGRHVIKFPQVSFYNEVTDEAKAMHARSLFSNDETLGLAYLSGVITTQFTERKINADQYTTTGIPNPNATEGFAWAGFKPAMMTNMVHLSKVLSDRDGTELPLMKRVMAINLLMAKTVISMESRAPLSSTLSSFTVGDNWLCVRMPNPGPMETPGGRSKMLPKTRYIWVFPDLDPTRTRAPHGFMRVIMRRKQGSSEQSHKQDHVSLLIKVCEYTQVDIASIISAPIRNNIVAALYLKESRNLYPDSSTEVGFMTPSPFADILGAALIFESRLGQYVADGLQFAARFNRASSNLWSTIKSTYSDFKRNPFASIVVPMLMAFQDSYEIPTDVISACMKIKMYAGSAKEKNERSMSLGTGEEFQKRLYHSFSHNDDGMWALDETVKRLMERRYFKDV